VFPIFKKIVLKNVDELIINSNKKRKEHGSFSEILFSGISFQSINIRMGIVLEKSWNEYIASIPNAKIINLQILDKKQIDLLFEFNNSIFYFEIKNNVNLDTEKSKATFNKIQDLKILLEKHFSKPVNAFLLLNRYSDSKKIKSIKKPLTKSIIYGYSELFKMFDIAVNEKDWNDFFKSVGTYIINNATSN